MTELTPGGPYYGLGKGSLEVPGFPSLSYETSPNGERLDLSIGASYGLFSGTITGSFQDPNRPMIPGPYDINIDLSGELPVPRMGKLELTTNGETVSAKFGPFEGTLNRGSVEADLKALFNSAGLRIDSRYLAEVAQEIEEALKAIEDGEVGAKC
jgi:hypothetical protein